MKFKQTTTPCGTQSNLNSLLHRWAGGDYQLVNAETFFSRQTVKTADVGCKRRNWELIGKPLRLHHLKAYSMEPVNKNIARLMLNGQCTQYQAFFSWRGRMRRFCNLTVSGEVKQSGRAGGIPCQHHKECGHITDWRTGNITVHAVVACRRYYVLTPQETAGSKSKTMELSVQAERNGILPICSSSSVGWHHRSS